MKASTAIVLAIVALAVAGVLFFTFGSSEGALVSLLALLPAGQALMKRKQLEGERTEVNADRDAAQAQRDALKKDFATVDKETAQNVNLADKHWEAVEEKPKEKDVQDAIDRFKRKGGGP